MFDHGLELDCYSLLQIEVLRVAKAVSANILLSGPLRTGRYLSCLNKVSLFCVSILMVKAISFEEKFSTLKKVLSGPCHVLSGKTSLMAFDP